MNIDIPDLIISIIFFVFLIYIYREHIEKYHKNEKIEKNVPDKSNYEILNDLKKIRGYKKILTNCIGLNKNVMDIVLIHETGIYIVEHKSDIGDIYGEEYAMYWKKREKGSMGRIKTTKIVNPIYINQKNVQFLRKMFKKEIPISSYITYKNKCELNRLDYKIFIEDIRIVRRNDVSSRIRVRSLNQEKVLSPEEINVLYELFLPLTELPISI